MGIKVSRSNKRIFPFRWKHTFDFLHSIENLGVNPLDNPLEVNQKLCTDADELLEYPRVHTKIVGTLIYLSLDLTSVNACISKYFLYGNGKV